MLQNNPKNEHPGSPRSTILMPTQLTPETKLVAAPDQVSCDLGGEVAILNTRSGVYYGLNEVAGRIWAHLTVPRTIAQIRDMILLEFEVDPARCERELFDLLASLVAAGLITIDGHA